MTKEKTAPRAKAGLLASGQSGKWENKQPERGTARKGRRHGSVRKHDGVLRRRNEKKAGAQVDSNAQTTTCPRTFPATGAADTFPKPLNGRPYWLPRSMSPTVGS